MLQKILLLIALSYGVFDLNAQGTNNVKLGIDAGLIILPDDAENLELFFNVESKVKARENIFIGLRFGLALNSHSFADNDNFDFIIDEQSDNGMVSFVPTIDYYPDGYGFSPYVGLGVGYHWLPSPVDVADRSGNLAEGSVKNRLGLLLRGGLEKRRLRLGVEYSFIPRADIELPDGQVAGTVGNSYFGVSAGLVLLGGGGGGLE